MEIIGAVFLVLSLAASQAQIEENPQLIRSLLDLFSESHIEPVVLLIDACAQARNYTEEPEVNNYRRTIDDLVDHAKSEYSNIDPSDEYYPMRAGELFRDLCGDMEIYFADIAAHVAKHNRYDEYFFGKPKLPHPLRGSQKIVKTCLAHERQIQHGDGSAVRRGLNELVNSIGNTRLDIDRATSSAQSISDQFRIFCEAVAQLLQSLMPSTPQTITLPTPVVGNWSPWTTGRCSATCGHGDRIGSRTCTNPAPLYGGATCTGSNRRRNTCVRQPCPIGGNWSPWTTGRCSVTCERGISIKSRTCTNPAPLYGGATCPGSSGETIACLREPCQMVKRNYVIGTFKNVNLGVTRLIISTLAPSGASVNISIPRRATPFSRTTRVSSGTAEQILLPSLASADFSIQDNGVLIESDADISVYVFKDQATTADIYTALPVTMAGSSYIATTYNQRSAITVTSHADDTEVQFTFPTNMIGSLLYNSRTHRAGSTFNVSLSRYQTFSIKGTNKLSGTLVESNKPITVVSGSQCSSIGSGACDYLAQQLLPTNLWGQEYNTLGLPQRVQQDFFEVMAREPNTEVRVNNIVLNNITRTGGAFTVRVPVSQYKVITTSHPSMATLYSPGKTSVNGDPFMTTMTGGNNFNTEFVHQTPGTGYTHYVSIIVPTASVAGIRMDGSPLPTIGSPSSAANSLSILEATIPHGLHIFSHTTTGTRFGVYAFGIKSHVSYGYYLL